MTIDKNDAHIIQLIKNNQKKIHRQKITINTVCKLHIYSVALQSTKVQNLLNKEKVIVKQ